MFRGRSYRALLAVAIAAILALPLLAAARSFTPAHASDHVAIPVAAGETTGPAERTPPQDPSDAFRPRERHRCAVGTAQSPGQAPVAQPSRPPLLVPPSGCAESFPRPSRSVPDLRPAVLQVFRC